MRLGLYIVFLFLLEKSSGSSPFDGFNHDHNGNINQYSNVNININSNLNSKDWINSGNLINPSTSSDSLSEPIPIHSEKKESLLDNNKINDHINDAWNDVSNDELFYKINGQNDIFGPFSRDQLRIWFQEGYFDPINTLVSIDPEYKPFVSIQIAFSTSNEVKYHDFKTKEVFENQFRDDQYSNLQHQRFTQQHNSIPSYHQDNYQQYNYNQQYNSQFEDGRSYYSKSSSKKWDLSPVQNIFSSLRNRIQDKTKVIGKSLENIRSFKDYALDKLPQINKNFPVFKIPTPNSKENKDPTISLSRHSTSIETNENEIPASDTLLQQSLQEDVLKTSSKSIVKSISQDSENIALKTLSQVQVDSFSHFHRKVAKHTINKHIIPKTSQISLIMQLLVPTNIRNSLKVLPKILRTSSLSIVSISIFSLVSFVLKISLIILFASSILSSIPINIQPLSLSLTSNLQLVLTSMKTRFIPIDWGSISNTLINKFQDFIQYFNLIDLSIISSVISFISKFSHHSFITLLLSLIATIAMIDYSIIYPMIRNTKHLGYVVSTMKMIFYLMTSMFLGGVLALQRQVLSISFFIVSLAIWLELYKGYNINQSQDDSNILGSDHLSMDTYEKLKYLQDLRDGVIGDDASNRWNLQDYIDNILESESYTLQSTSNRFQFSEHDKYFNFRNIAFLSLVSIVSLSSIGNMISSDYIAIASSNLMQLTRRLLVHISSIEAWTITSNHFNAAIVFISLPILLWIQVLQASNKIALTYTKYPSIIELISRQSFRSRVNRRSDDRHGWTTNGPNVMSGIAFQGVFIRRHHLPTCENLTVRILPGEITLLQDVSLSSCEDIFDVIYQSNVDVEISPRNAIEIHGRSVEEWNRQSLQKRITYLKHHENPLYLHAGVVAGWLPQASSQLMERHIKAAELTRVGSIISSLCQGPGTMLSSKPYEFINDLEEACLSTNDWMRMALCRALTFIDKDIILLSSPFKDISEDEQIAILRYLRSIIRKDQIIIISSLLSHNDYIIPLVDKIITLENGKIIDIGIPTQQEATLDPDIET